MAPGPRLAPVALVRLRRHSLPTYTSPINPAPSDTANTIANERKCQNEAFPFWNDAKDRSTGPKECSKISRSRNRRTPAERPPRKVLYRARPPRSRPMGRPRKMVNPAMAPSRRVCAVLMRSILIPTGEVANHRAGSGRDRGVR